MPGQFGKVSRVHVVKDPESGNKKLKMYVVSKDDNGNFIPTNSTVKNNLRKVV